MSENNGYATAENLLASAGRRRIAEVEIDGQKFSMTSITAGDFAEVQALAPNEKDNAQRKRAALLSMQARLVYHVFVNPDGSKLLTMQQSEDLAKLDARLTQAMFSAAAEHAGIDETDLKKLAKNSDAASTEDSPTV